MLSSFLSTFLYVFTSLVTVVNPIGAAMFFLTITSGATRAQRMTLSNKVCIYFLIMALVTLCAGSFVLSFFGISLGVLRVAGGLILFSAGWLALNNTSSSSEGEEEVVEQLLDKEKFTFTVHQIHSSSVGEGRAASLLFLCFNTSSLFFQ